MARFLSAEWFADVARQAPPAPARTQPDDLVLEQVVRDTPDGEVRYRVVVHDAVAHLEPPEATQTNNGSRSTPPDLTIACDWATATAIAQGQLSAQAALMEGRLRINGNLARLAGRARGLVGLDPVPDGVRRHTTYG
ncbi:MAG TPA: SCP2 sterol-binding domain-containing protein [Acidimicrobiales bacterium]